MSDEASRTDFLHQLAATGRFRYGQPRDVTVAPDGTRVLFLRAASGTDRTTSLWRLDVATGAETMLADGGALSGGELSATARALRERTRESAAGIVGYATDDAAHRVVFTVDGQLWTVTDGGTPVSLPANGSVLDPRLDPAGTTVAYVAEGAVRLIGVDGTGDRALATPEGDDVTYGLPDHVAGESMHRYRGHWWSPDGTRLLVARVDESPVTRWYLADPANPGARPTEVRYPAAGTANAVTTLWLYDVATSLGGASGGHGARTEVVWDRDFEYLAEVRWADEKPLLLVQNRSQRDVRILSVDPATGATRLVHADHDDQWWELIPGLPATTASGALVWSVDDAATDTRRLVVDGTPVTPPGLQVREVTGVDGDAVLFLASDEPTEQHVWRWHADTGPVRLSTEPGVHTASTAGGTTVLLSRSLAYPGVRATVAGSGIASVAAAPVLTPRVAMHAFGERKLRTAVLLPSWYDRASGTKLPVLLDPYGGPHGQVAVHASNVYLLSQWFAEQGYAVLITDGRGTPARGPRWEHSVRGDKLTFALTDQVDALHAATAEYPELDLTRVGIRGWSYGGYLAAAAVLRRPDVFHVAVADAPVTDPLLYDTHWQERYLGHPAEDPEAYQRNSLIPDAPKLTRPLLIVHGMVDDNVVVAHTLKLSGALLAAGRPHAVLPLTGVTHMSGTATEHLPLLELDFLDRVLHPATS
ncbi:MAG TPA: prolyl oligopeptidase family serine peptidase [Actinocatenispora sp.]